MNREKWLVLAIVFLALTVLFSGFWIGNSIVSSSKKTLSNLTVQNPNEDILSFSEAAIFLKMSEGELKWLLDNSQTKDGKGIPYYKIGARVEFSKLALSKWITYIADNRFDF